MNIMKPSIENSGFKVHEGGLKNVELNFRVFYVAPSQFYPDQVPVNYSKIHGVTFVWFKAALYISLKSFETENLNLKL